MTTILIGDALAAKLAEPDGWLTTGEVAGLMRVNSKTVTRWCAQGRVPCIRTPGRQRRISSAVARAILAGELQP